MLDIFKTKRNGTGAIAPNATTEDAAKNYRIEELVAAAAAVNYQNTTPEKWRVHPKRSQTSSGTCVAQTIAKMGGILREQATGEFIEYSATPTYQSRSNKPSAGMIGTEALDQWRKEGLTLETLVPSQNLTDAGVDAQPVNEYDKQVAAISKLDAYLLLPTRNFDLAVSTMTATGKPLMVWHQWDYAEWDAEVTSLKTSKQLGRDSFEGHHSTTLTPNVGIWREKIGATTEDSWGNVGIGGMGVRWLTKDFYNARNTFTAYPTTFKTYADLNINPAKPRYNFTRDIRYGARLDRDIQALQDILKYENLYPANHDSTGNYLEVTRKGILAWQEKHGVPTDGLNGTYVGTKTRAALNALYA